MSHQNTVAAMKAHKKLSKELENTFVESESNGLLLTVDGKGMIKGVVFEDKKLIGDEDAMIKAITGAWNKVNLYVTKMQKQGYAKLEQELQKNIQKR